MDNRRKAEIIFLAVIVGSVILFNYLVNNFSVIPALFKSILGIFGPFVWGFAFIFILNVIMRKIESILAMQFSTISKSSLRIISLITSLVLVIGILAFVFFMVVPSFISAISDIIKILPQAFKDLSNNLVKWFDSYPEVVKQIQQLEIQWTEISKQFLNNMAGSFGSVLTNVFSVLTSTVTILFNIFVGLVFSIYVLLSKEKLIRHFKKVLFAMTSEKNANTIMDFFTLTNHTFSNFLTGQLTEGFINGILAFIGCTIFRVPYAPVIAVMIGFFAMIPYFGAIIGTVISFFLVLTGGNLTTAIVFLIYQIVIQQIDGNIIYPKVVGDQIGLPAIWVMFAVTVGANVAGFVGMVLFVPMASVLYAVMTLYINRRLAKRKINIDDISSRNVKDIFPKKEDN